VVLISVLNEYSLRWGEFAKSLSGVSCWAAGGVNPEPLDITIGRLWRSSDIVGRHASVVVVIAALGLIFNTNVRSFSIPQSKEIDN
jgi:hypothetical protein